MADDKHLGEKIPLPFGRELKELTDGFNTMSVRLRGEIDGLEKRVQERTVELKQVMMIYWNKTSPSASGQK